MEKRKWARTPSQTSGHAATVILSQRLSQFKAVKEICGFIDTNINAFEDGEFCDQPPDDYNDQIVYEKDY
ncbi:hypothetical protein ABVK25_003849 [Lepraria finkii]|uniref:Uncharacterized protein n=1 Tax=Lepraria finkii TaxID=1340010 RepID=A0ABR4BDU4_9LECA